MAKIFEQNSMLYKTFIPKIYKEANDLVSSLSTEECERIRLIVKKVKKVEEKIATIDGSEMPTERKKKEIFNCMMEFNNQQHIKVLNVLGRFLNIVNLNGREILFLPNNFFCYNASKVLSLIHSR
jgi:mannose-6-phosphate isomerase class I